MFRFHTGSIKSIEVTVRENAVTLFRFHTGSIKKINTTKSTLSTRKFRFHTGSIKRMLHLRRCHLSKACFDSILVRLKVETLFETVKAEETFRFHTGSIKRQLAGEEVSRLPHQFRFHTGSIKRLGFSQSQ